MFESLGKRSSKRPLGRPWPAREGSIIDKDNTTIIEGAGKSSDIKAASSSCAARSRTCTSDKRPRGSSKSGLAKLGRRAVAKLNVGATTESEMK